MQKEELSDSRNRQAAPRNEGQDEGQIWQRAAPMRWARPHGYQQARAAIRAMWGSAPHPPPPLPTHSRPEPTDMGAPRAAASRLTAARPWGGGGGGRQEERPGCRSKPFHPCKTGDWVQIKLHGDFDADHGCVVAKGVQLRLRLLRQRVVMAAQKAQAGSCAPGVRCVASRYCCC
jgi:hypothetical protein